MDRRPSASSSPNRSRAGAGRRRTPGTTRKAAVSTRPASKRAPARSAVPSPQERRAATRVVRRYLEQLDAPDPERVRSRLRRQLERAERKLADESALGVLERLELIQARIDATAGLRALPDPAEAAAVEDEFVACAAAWAAHRGITWDAFRAVGVPASVLTRAGIPRQQP